MMMIVGLHVLSRGSLTTGSPLVPDSINFLPAYFFESGFIIAVNSFVMISGYFFINLSFRKLCGFYLQVLQYSILISFIFFIYDLMNNALIDRMDILQSFIPYLSRRWWFATDYIVLFLASPLLNIVIKSLTGRNFTLCILIMTFIWVITPSLNFPIIMSAYLSFVQLIYFYFIGAYMRHKDIRISKKFSFSMYLGVTLLICTTIYIIAHKFGYNPGYQNFFLRYNNILVCISSVSFFLFFKSLNIGYIKWINGISPLVFAVYLIHEHPKIQNVLYSFFQCDRYYNSYWFIPNMFLTIISVFLLGISIEYVRKKILGSFENSLITKIENSKKLNRLLANIK
jgi:surface polysaccharide O-acyltransferase-like enzyme